MPFSPERKLNTILGTVVERYIRPMRESWLRRKYIGVWSRDPNILGKSWLSYPTKLERI